MTTPITRGLFFQQLAVVNNIGIVMSIHFRTVAQTENSLWLLIPFCLLYSSHVLSTLLWKTGQPNFTRAHINYQQMSMILHLSAMQNAHLDPLFSLMEDWITGAQQTLQTRIVQWYIRFITSCGTMTNSERVSMTLNQCLNLTTLAW